HDATYLCDGRPEERRRHRHHVGRADRAGLDRIGRRGPRAGGRFERVRAGGCAAGRRCRRPQRARGCRGAGLRASLLDAAHDRHAARGAGRALVTLSVLLVGDYPSDPTLGSSKVFYKLQEELQALGHRCDIVFGEEIGAPRSRQIGQIVAPWRAASAIAKRMDAVKYDVVDVASAEGLWVGVLKKIGGYRRTALICRSNGLEQLNYRRMIADHDAGLTRKGWTRRIWYPLTRLTQVEAAARVSDRLVLLNEGDRRYAVEHGWKPDGEIDIVPHGVSDRYLASDIESDDVARGEGLLFCGSWDHVKGIAYVVRAFERLHERGRSFRLTVLGPGVPETRVLDDFAARVRPFVRVVARVPEADVIGMYRRHDLLLWTPTYEGF